MAGPWEKYGVAETAEAKGPWSKYGARSYDLTDVPGQAIVNAPADAAKFAGELAQFGLALGTKPVSTVGGIVKGVGDTLAGGLRAGAQKVLPEQAFKFLDQFDSPETTKRISDIANAVGGYVADNYGSWEAIKRSMAERPVQTASDFATLLTGGQFATLRAAPTVSNVFGRVATQVDPTMIALRTGVGGVNALRSAAASAPNLRDLANAANAAVAPYVDPGAVAANSFVKSIEDPAAAAAGLRATQNAFVTPGAPALSASERLIEAGVPSFGLTQLEQKLASEQPAVALAREQQRAAAIQAQLGRAEGQVQSQAAALTPVNPPPVSEVRNAFLRELADEQAALANTAQGVAQPLPTVRQADVGGAIQTRGAERSEQLKKEYIRPGYREAFDIAGDAPLIDLGRPLATAERFVKDIGAIVDPTKVSPGVRNMLRLEAGPDAGPRVVSLEDFQAVRAELRKQARAAARTDSTRASSLQAVIQDMNDALKVSSVPKAAKDALLEADRRVSEVQIPMYRTGETGKMLMSGSYNQPRTLPSQQVEAFIKTEEAAEQFVRTFENDPRALQSLQQGILDLYRQDIVNPTTRAVDPKRAAKFEADKARELDILEAAGLNVRETMGMVRRDAAAVQRAQAALVSEAKKFGQAENATAVVDLALQSPSNMTSVRNRLTPTAREALSGELVNRATSAIERGDPTTALAYLTKNEQAIKIGLGKAGAKTYDDLIEVAKLQDEVAKLSAQAPKTNLVTSAKLADSYTLQQLTDLQVVFNDIRRMQKAEEMGATTGASVKKPATEMAEVGGVAPSKFPNWFSPTWTAVKSAGTNLLKRMDRKATAQMLDLAYNNPDKLIPLLEDAVKAKVATAAKQPSRPLTIPVGVERAARGATAVNALSRDNQNAMAR